MIITVYHCQHGSMPDFQVSNDDLFYVIRERFEDGGGGRLDAAIVDTAATWDEAEQKVRELSMRVAAASLGRKGGAAKSERKAASSASNGRKGGRPRKAS